MPDDIIKQIAAVAVAHERTVERRMLGLHVRGRVEARIDAELARRGIRPGVIGVAPPSSSPTRASEPPSAI